MLNQWIRGHFAKKEIHLNLTEMSYLPVVNIDFREKSIIEMYLWCNIHFRCIIDIHLKWTMHRDISLIALQVKNRVQE